MFDSAIRRHWVHHAPWHTQPNRPNLICCRLAWHRMADALRPWHERIAAEVKDSACLHADETGWRVDGFR